MMPSAAASPRLSADAALCALQHLELARQHRVIQKLFQAQYLLDHLLDHLLDEQVTIAQQMKKVNADIQAHQDSLEAAKLELEDVSAALALIEEAISQRMRSRLIFQRSAAEQTSHKEARDTEENDSEEERKAAGSEYQGKRVKRCRLGITTPEKSKTAATPAPTSMTE